MAEREGFEPSVELVTPQSLSRRSPSADSVTSPRNADLMRSTAARPVSDSSGLSDPSDYANRPEPQPFVAGLLEDHSSLRR
jgi:hypothetical protein